MEQFHLSIFCIILLLIGNVCSNEKKAQEENELLQNDPQESFVVISDEEETDSTKEDKREQPSVSDDLDSAHISTYDAEERKPNSSNVNQIESLLEFIPEKQRGERNEMAEELYASAVDLLTKKRWAGSLNRDLRSAYLNLEEAAKSGHLDAEKLLAFSYLFGDYRWSIDEAKQIFTKLADLGSADGHLGLGFLYSTGIGLSEPVPSRGFLHYTFSALGGNPLAQMALGYRYAYGVSTTQSCEKSLMWYSKVAERVASKVKLVGTVAIQRIRIPDEIESSASTSTILDNNVFSYYKYLAETGDIQAVLGLGQLYLTGGKGIPLDIDAAAKYFMMAAEAGNSQALGYLGKMYLEGTSATPQNNLTAFQYFRKAADKGNAAGQSGLGMMFLYGYGVKADSEKALKFFNLAAEQGLPDAQLHLGQMYFQGMGVSRDFKQALRYFQLSSQSGHILAIYNLAQMHAKGTGVMRNCQFAMALYKNVAERGRWSERFMDAYYRYQSGAIDEAALRYLFLGEFGYEAAQTNFAYLMDNEETHLFPEEESYKRAYMNWQRSANQDYAFARVKLGDYNYYGLGSDKDMTEAANHYKSAANTDHNAQAMFNLGYMYQHGLGVPKDLHLAKRYYDLATETSTEAFVPVSLALVKLRMEFLWDYLFVNVLVKTPALNLLDTVLGPDWDLYLMSLCVCVIVWLTYCYFRNRQNRGAVTGAAGVGDGGPPR